MAVAALSVQISAVEKSVADVQTKVGSLPAPVDPPEDPQLDTVTEQVNAAALKLGIVNAQLQAIVNPPVATPVIDPPVVTPPADNSTPAVQPES